MGEFVYKYITRASGLQGPAILVCIIIIIIIIVVVVIILEHKLANKSVLLLVSRLL